MKIRCAYCNKRIKDVGRFEVVLHHAVTGQAEWFCTRRHRHTFAYRGAYHHGYPWLRWLRRVL